jgi:diadenosine tetraphosphate (Ap4A) HIT family hydrolase
MELREIMAVVVDLHRRFSEELGIDGVNLGMNAGTTAGQTLAHAHLHLIPRYEGDVPDPAGGIRWIFPERARYWEGTASEPQI